jgi:hypothetical protein
MISNDRKTASQMSPRGSLNATETVLECPLNEGYQE